MADIETSEAGLVEERQSWTATGPLFSRLPDDEIHRIAELAATSTADPSTLGLWALATGTWISATVLGGFLPATVALAAAPPTLFFSGMTQFIAGLFAFRRADSLLASAFCALGALYVAAGMMMFLGAVGLDTPATGLHEQLGFLLESYAFISLALTLAAMRRNWVLTAVMGFLTAGYAMTGIGQFRADFSGLGPVAAAGGGCLLAAALLAYYLGLALLANSAWNDAYFPILGDP